MPLSTNGASGSPNIEAFHKQECVVSFDLLPHSVDNQHASSLAYKSHEYYHATASGFKPISGSYKLVNMQAVFDTQHTKFRGQASAHS